MKNSPVTTVLLVAVCVLAALVFFLELVFEHHFRTLRGLQPHIANAQNAQNFVNALANDALEYSKTHPAIDPILQPVGVKPAKPAAPAAAKPIGK